MPSLLPLALRGDDQQYGATSVFAAFPSGTRSAKGDGMTRKDALLLLCARIGFNPPA